MNRRTALKTLSLTALGLSVSKLSSAQSEDAPDLSGLTLALRDLPAGDWTIYGGIDIFDRVFEEMRGHPEQLPAREGLMYFHYDYYPWRLDERRQLVSPFRVTKMEDARMSSLNPAWTEAVYERVFACSKSGHPHLFPVEFLVRRQTLEVEAYRIPKIV